MPATGRCLVSCQSTAPDVGRGIIGRALTRGRCLRPAITVINL